MDRRLAARGLRQPCRARARLEATLRANLELGDEALKEQRTTTLLRETLFVTGMVGRRPVRMAERSGHGRNAAGGRPFT